MKKKPASKLFKTIETGLDALPMITCGNTLVPNFQIESLRETLKTIEVEGKTASNDASLPEHVRGLAGWASVMAEDLDAQLKAGRATPEDAARAGLQVGLWYYRFKQWIHEKPALAGKKCRAAAQKKGRTPPSGSLREVLLDVDNWKNKSTGQLVHILKNSFPNMSQASITRQIRRLKKSGQ